MPSAQPSICGLMHQKLIAITAFIPKDHVCLHFTTYILIKVLSYHGSVPCTYLYTLHLPWFPVQVL